MSLETIAIATVKWVWDRYGKDLTESTLEKAKGKWAEFKWQEAAERYCTKLRSTCSTVRVLGNPKPINLDEIFTDVYVLDKPTAFRRFDIQTLQSKPFGLDTLQTQEKNRKPALRLALKKKRLFILGKPGAGKTTFLKYLALKAIDGKIPKTPIFISLREWADSNLELLDFIVEQFEICSFPDPKAFIVNLLSHGDALVLFDGLDEVNVEGNQRSKMITTLTNFSKRYQDIHIYLTCRIAATDYSFDQFTYLEIADFDRNQQNRFVSKWYQDDQKTLQRFVSEFDKPENKGLRDLARTPLLLTLLCLAFDETLSFPLRRVDLYKESIDALLKKWDSSRGIRRDEVYRKLSPARKEQMLARIAAENFENNSYFIAQAKLESQILHYLRQLPDTEELDLDGELILKTIENQHGILVERAHSIYSFSHLTFQEYLTAKFIVENAATGTIDRLIRNHFRDNRWKEIFLMTASSLDSADYFFDVFSKHIFELIRNDACKFLLDWAFEKSKPLQVDKDIKRLFPTGILLALVANFPADVEILRLATGATKPREAILVRSKGTNFTLEFPANLPPGKYIFDFDVVGLIAKSLIEPQRENPHNEEMFSLTGKSISITRFSESINFPVKKSELPQQLQLTVSNLRALSQYLKSVDLYLSCLSVASVSNRKDFEQKIYQPPQAG